MTIQDASGKLFNIKQFIENSEWFDSDDVDAIDMAWDALCNSSPMVLTLEEAKNLGYEHIWVEYNSCCLQPQMSNISDWEGYKTYYGTDYRWWMGNKPTDEQMKNTPWDIK